MFGPEELSALYLSAKVGLFATLVCLPFAIALAWYLARYEFRLKFMVEALLQLPMVLPPVVLGYLLLILFGQQGLIGQYLHILGLELAFNWKGAVLASMVVAFPLMVQPIRLSFQLMNRQLEHVAGTLGATPVQVFYSISLPLALPGMIIGSILCFSRSLGEFGATITFVGNIPGETRTMPIAIYSFLQQPNGEEMALRLVMLSLVLAFSALIANYFILQKYQKKLEG
ncbi:molybdate ABC transporter permease subunit [Acinetobacter radioresistens]|jgi:molybdate transport system permease protein|uniref:Molybdenum transport system permease n=1 Tax=Acinetobacter radioresistens TaxID=40216 RepID=A0A8H2K1Y0_ACIRA|nr:MULTISPECIES: molybdate ABC transporter permease subunit [Acinetobacter]EJO34040.1 molybdate ABC transporter, permease protein [Acinetobacter radioresistens WC-A-157]ENV89084.1 molybdate ABC transporter, permease [Acinetobacter radioresistens DSM 6976 = NBRC 102413 = CIP 103788]EXB31887.1 molybdate ABC transporter, permease protein [Acinetobacter sp. 1461402]EXB72800.1 molybdate ABC transporter, permease protein [Acinetobacter sp. 230853]EXC32809.1 molybdate ABC transporter, permease protei